jgi:hypothetical protein
LLSGPSSRPIFAVKGESTIRQRLGDEALGLTIANADCALLDAEAIA